MGEVFRISQRMRLRPNARFRYDLVGLTALRVCLCEVWESFRQVKGYDGAALIRTFTHSLLSSGTKDDRLRDDALKDADGVFIMAVGYKGKGFFSLNIGTGKGSCAALDSGVSADVAGNVVPDALSLPQDVQQPAELGDRHSFIVDSAIDAAA